MSGRVPVSTAVFVLMLITMPLPAQVRLGRYGQMRRAVRVRRAPCWQEAGVSRSTMLEVRSIRQQMRSEIGALCSDTSLSPQQRRERMREIRLSARQQIENLISPSQQEQIRSCQAARGNGRRRIGGGGRGPCGDLPRGASATSTVREGEHSSLQAEEKQRSEKDEEDVPDFEDPQR